MREHAAELTAAHHTEYGGRIGGREEGFTHFDQTGRVMAWAAAVCSRRKACSFSASASSVAARIATAVRAALAAPASPMAKVDTGTPFGICTIDSSESSPRRYF